MLFRIKENVLKTLKSAALTNLINIEMLLSASAAAAFAFWAAREAQKQSKAAIDTYSETTRPWVGATLADQPDVVFQVTNDGKIISALQLEFKNFGSAPAQAISILSAFDWDFPPEVGENILLSEEAVCNRLSKNIDNTHILGIEPVNYPTGAALFQNETFKWGIGLSSNIPKGYDHTFGFSIYVCIQYRLSSRKFETAFMISVDGVGNYHANLPLTAGSKIKKENINITRFEGAKLIR